MQLPAEAEPPLVVNPLQPQAGGERRIRRHSFTSGRKLFAVRRSGVLQRVDEGDMGRSVERAACNMLLERLISHADVATSTTAAAAAAARCTTRSMHEEGSIGEDCRRRGG